jgi:hypothetical protein
MLEQEDKLHVLKEVETARIQEEQSFFSRGSRRKNHRYQKVELKGRIA